MNPLKILSIETSCDETSLSLVEVVKTSDKAVFSVLGDITQSQIDIMREFGGVFPAVARREHQHNIVPILLKVLGVTQAPSSLILRDTPSYQEGDTLRSGIVEKISEILSREQSLSELFMEHVLPITNPGITHICVTSGPGLEPALWVGINFARALGVLWDIPVIPVNHMEGHVLSVLVPETILTTKQSLLTLSPIENTTHLTNSQRDTSSMGGGLEEVLYSFTYYTDLIQFPALALLVSGGHTEIVEVSGIGDYKIIGRTRDDAVGEAFDKVARILSLPYPGGPEISKLAQRYRENNTDTTGQLFPRPMIHSGDYDFSFSGLKTAVLYYVRDLPHLREGVATIGAGGVSEISDNEKHKIAYEFETAAVDVLITKTLRAIKNTYAQSLIIGGGVAANNHLRSELQRRIGEVIGTDNVHFPTTKLSTDNSLMIALAGYFKIIKNPAAIYEKIVADGNWEL
jgi:N6-L-threonylcarbamoyladenine synthase